MVSTGDFSKKRLLGVESSISVNGAANKLINIPHNSNIDFEHTDSFSIRIVTNYINGIAILSKRLGNNEPDFLTTNSTAGFQIRLFANALRFNIRSANGLEREVSTVLSPEAYVGQILDIVAT